MQLSRGRRLYRAAAALSVWVMSGVAGSAAGTPTLDRERVRTPFPPVTASILAAHGWQDTGLVLNRLDVVEIEYLYGKWSTWLEEIPPHGAQGDPAQYICAAEMPSANCAEELPEAVKGSLIARIDGTQAIPIGASAVFVASSRGKLFVSINDAHDPRNLADNVGSIVVQITVSPTE